MFVSIHRIRSIVLGTPGANGHRQLAIQTDNGIVEIDLYHANNEEVKIESSIERHPSHSMTQAYVPVMEKATT